MRSASAPGLTVAGLFAGIGGVEVGLAESGHEPRLLCDVWEPAQQVLRARFPGVPLATDIRDLRSLPAVDVVTAGFPCTDLSQAGRTAGIGGKQSGLVAEVFRLLRRRHPTWLVLENVRNLLVLDGGQGMRYLVDALEDMKCRWAYRLVDSRSSGTPQRRQRVLFVASRTEDPCNVVLSDDAGEPEPTAYGNDAFGFYWTEGLRGLGWAQDAVPTLKGGSTIGIPSPPAVWIPEAELGRRIVTPSVEDGEVLQGFPRGWTEPAETGQRRSARWKLVGNAVSVGVSRWLGRRLADPGKLDPRPGAPLTRGDRWPTAAWGYRGKAWTATASMWPERQPYNHLLDVLHVPGLTPLSYRGTQGFLERTGRAKLRFNEDFILDVKEHAEYMRS